MIGPHVNVWTQEAKDTIRRAPPPILKVLNTAINVEELQRWREARPDGILIYRHWFPDESLSDVAGRVRATLVGMEGIRHLVDVVETPWNEAWQANGAELGAYAPKTVEAVERLHDAGCARVSVGHFSMGNPARFEDWEAFYPALAAGDVLDLHEYSRPTMQSDANWHCLRYRQVYARLPVELRLPLYIGECGLDWTGAADPVPGWGNFAFGWRAHDVPPADYGDQLRWYMGELAQDSWVLGAVVFACGTYEDFRSFDVAGAPEIEELFKEPGRIFNKPGVVQVGFNIGPGIKEAMDALGDTPTSNEVWIGHLGSYAAGELNDYHYNKDMNRVFVSFPTAQG